MQTLEEKVFNVPAISKGPNLGTEAALACDLEVYPLDCLVVVDIAKVLTPLFQQDRLRGVSLQGLAPPPFVPEAVFKAAEAHVVVFGFVVYVVDCFQSRRGMLVAEELPLVGSDYLVVLLVDLVQFVIVIPAVVVFLGAHIVVGDGVLDSYQGAKSYPFGSTR